MSDTSSPIPVLRGSGGATLQAEDSTLVWSRRRKEKRFPLQAVREVRAEGRALTVELTAPPGTTPAVYRVRGVSATAATVFADAVTASLPEERELDGMSLVTEGATVESEDDAYGRKVKLGVWAVGLVTVGVAAPMAIVGSTLAATAFLLWTPLSVGAAVFGVWVMRVPYDEWRLPRYGITVEARRKSRGSYAYTDLHGVVRGAAVSGSAPTIMVAYDPENLGPVVRAKSWIGKVGSTLFCLAILLVGLALVLLDVYVAVSGFQD